MKVWVERSRLWTFGPFTGLYRPEFLHSRLQDINLLDGLMRKFSNYFVAQRHTFLSGMFHSIFNFFKSTVSHLMLQTLSGTHDRHPANPTILITWGFRTCAPSLQGRITSFWKLRIVICFPGDGWISFFFSLLRSKNVSTPCRLALTLAWNDRPRFHQIS